MESKILSVGIAAYNMEKYLGRCIESLLIPNLEKLEIIIVNNASTDNTFIVAEKYHLMYPKSIKVVNIETNRHYGGAVNVAIENSTGKYFRTVDADDWVDKEALCTLVKKMECKDVDCFFTNYVRVHENGPKEKCRVDADIYDKIINLNEVALPQKCLAMHAMSFKLQLIRDLDFRMTEGVYYTDTEYVFFLLSKSTSFYGIDICLYQYFVGRNEQSVGLKSIKRNYNHFRIVYDRINSNTGDMNSLNGRLALSYFRVLLLKSMALSAVLLNTENEYDFRGIIKELDNQMICDCKNLKEHHIPYFKLWLRNTIFDRFLIKLLRKYIEYRDM